jgi:hypothetical protein
MMGKGTKKNLEEAFLGEAKAEAVWLLTKARNVEERHARLCRMALSQNARRAPDVFVFLHR